MKRLLKAINEGINNALILFDDESFKKGSSAGEMANEWLWIENNTVDLGLPSGTRWATCNIGATIESDCGLYFLWADPTGYTEGHNDVFAKLKYKWYDSSKKTCSKYNEEDGLSVLDIEDDPAYVHSNGMLVSPSVLQYNELKEYCDWIWTNINRTNGYVIQSKINNEYIFLPAAGYCSNRLEYTRKEYGNYWTNESFSNGAFVHGLYFGLYNVDTKYCFARYNGYTVRGVLR